MAAIASNARWYAVQTQTNGEGKAERHLTAQGFAVFLPRYRKTRRHARRTEIVGAPLFPRYLFVLIDLGVQRWRSINGTAGVARLVGTADGPAPVPHGVVEGLQERRNAAGFIEIARESRFAPGETVRIVGGAFASALGLFESLSGADRVAILLRLLGKETRIELDEALVERAD